jgi:PAS domain S-box-containing protein
MTEEQRTTDTPADLRRRAEEVLQRQSDELLETAPEDLQDLIHELRVHQVELEMQNEELRRTQRELERARDEYSDLYDFAPVGYLTLSERGTILQANLTAGRMLGVDRSCLVDRPLTDFIVREDQDAFYLHRRRVFETQESQTVEVRMEREGGSELWVRIESAPTGRNDDQAAWRAAISDVTKQKKAEKALHTYADRLRVLHEIDEAIMSAYSMAQTAEAVVQRIPRLISCQRASVGTYDPETHELSLLAIHSCRDQPDPAAVWREPVDPASDPVLKKLMAGERCVVEDLQTVPVSSPWIQRLQAGAARVLICEPIIIHGDFAGMVSVGRKEPDPLLSDQMDVMRELATRLGIAWEQARLHEELQRHAGELEQLVQQRTAELEASEARFRTIFEEAGIGIALADTVGRLKATNPALRRMLRHSREELSGRCLFDFLGGAGDAGRELLRKVSERERSEHTEQLPYLLGDGERGYANLTLSFLRRKGDSSPLVLVLMEDVTERKRAHEMLVEAERMAAMGRMGTSLAHEINNPLQSVIGCLGLAAELQEEGSDALQLLDVAREELLRAANIVRRMRDITRPGDGRRELANIGKLIQRTVTVTHNQAKSQDVTVDWEGGDTLPQVPMVRDRIQQVVLNLVLNAIEAMPEGGQLRIQAARTSDPAGVEVAFTDTGIGIPSDRLEHLFEAFHGTKPEGAGLGLYVTFNIVQEHGGWIEVESEVEEGCTFTIWLPQEKDSDEDRI